MLVICKCDKRTFKWWTKLQKFASESGYIVMFRHVRNADLPSSADKIEKVIKWKKLKRFSLEFKKRDERNGNFL